MPHALHDINIQVLHHADFEEIVAVWEAAVKATHHFLPASAIETFKPLILNEYLYLVDLRGARSPSGALMGFLGVAGNSLEMLFLHPRYFGQGLGKAFVQFAITALGVTKVDVNEQNEGAVGFYLHLGFKTVGRSPLDAQGNPYPILHLQLS